VTRSDGLGGHNGVLRARELPGLSARTDAGLWVHLVQVVLDNTRADEQLAPISGFVRPCAASRATCASCVVSSSTVQHHQRRADQPPGRKPVTRDGPARASVNSLWEPAGLRPRRPTGSSRSTSTWSVEPTWTCGRQRCSPGIWPGPAPAEVSRASATTGQGVAVTDAHWVAAILYNGLGRYQKAVDRLSSPQLCPELAHAPAAR
jgi:hypothetical protein